MSASEAIRDFVFAKSLVLRGNIFKSLKSGGLTSFESVLRLFVPPQVHLPLETFGAQVAGERLVAGVFPAVRDEVGALAERLPAHLTLVRLLT